MDNIQLTTMTNVPQLPCYNNEADIIKDDAFSYDGYQVVRSEFFAHI